MFYRSSEIRTLVKTRSMQLATNEKRPLNLCRKKKKKKKISIMELPTTTDQFQFLARKRYVKRVKKIAFIFLDYNALSDSWEDFLFFSFFLGRDSAERNESNGTKETFEFFSSAIMTIITAVFPRYEKIRMVHCIEAPAKNFAD